MSKVNSLQGATVFNEAPLIKKIWINYPTATIKYTIPISGAQIN
jgi:hypothetical protein